MLKVAIEPLFDARWVSRDAAEGRGQRLLHGGQLRVLDVKNEVLHPRHLFEHSFVVTR